MVAATINFAASTERLDQETTSDGGERGGEIQRMKRRSQEKRKKSEGRYPDRRARNKGR